MGCVTPATPPSLVTITWSVDQFSSNPRAEPKSINQLETANQKRDSRLDLNSHTDDCLASDGAGELVGRQRGRGLASPSGRRPANQRRANWRRSLRPRTRRPPTCWLSSSVVNTCGRSSAVERRLSAPITRPKVAFLAFHRLLLVSFLSNSNTCLCM